MIAAFDPSELHVIIEEAQAETAAKMKGVREMIAEYHGPFWTEGGGGAYLPENTYFEYMTAMVPRIVYHNPRVRVRSRRTGPQDKVAVAMRHGLNKLVRDMKFSMVVRDLVVDMLFGWGVALVKESPRDGMKAPADSPIEAEQVTWPVIERISPGKFFMDPDAYEYRSCRYLGHEWRMDKDDLLKRARENPDEGWDIEEIEALAVQTDDGEGDQKRGVPRLATRKQVCAFDVWVPEIELSDSPGRDSGYFGTMFTLGVGSSSSGEVYDHNEELVTKESKVGFLREPRPFFGPRTGPYTLFGCYRVPDSPYPLSPLVATRGQIEDLNRQVKAGDAADERYKRMIAVPDNATAQKVKRMMHDWVVQVPFEAEKAMVAQLELGGRSDTQLASIITRKERLDRVLGMDETMRGNATGEGTASEHVLANESAQARISEMVERAHEACADVLGNCAHYMFYSDTVVFPLGEESLEDEDVVPGRFPGKVEEVWFTGGDPDPDSGQSFDDLELEIEPFSMERTNEGLTQQRMLQVHQMTMEALPLMQAFFDFPWRDHYKKLGETMNMPNLEELVPPEMLERFRAMFGAMTQGQVPAGVGTAANEGPRLSGHLNLVQPRSQASVGAGPPTAARVLGGGMPGQQSGAQAGGAQRPQRVG